MATGGFLTSRPAVTRTSQPQGSASATAFLTREDGKNGKLRTLLDKSGIASEELPCIAFERLPGFDELCDALSAGDSAWVVITSPEAATVFLDAWKAAGSDRAEAPARPKLATVGAGTAQILEAAGLAADFVPSKATGKVLAAELPAEGGGNVLYPASALAADTVAEGLDARGIGTRRVNTYTTVPAEWTPSDLERAEAASVVTFASPSSVRVWAERAGTGATAVCIGETSAKEARRVGFGKVICPEKPGVDSWAACCIDVVNGS